MTFIDYIAENNGLNGKDDTTTGTISSGTNSLVVADVTGFAISDPITVLGADTSGVDLETTISNIAGTTFTLTDNASTSVTNAQCTNRSYDEISLEPVAGLGAASGLTLIGSFPGSGNTSGKIRYAINNSPLWGSVGPCSSIILIGCMGATGSTAPPVYDPYRRVMSLGSSVPIRQPTISTVYERFHMPIFPPWAQHGTTHGESQRTTIPSPQGKDLWLGLADSNGNGTGTFGNVDVYLSAASLTRILSLNGTTKKLALSGLLLPGNFSGGTGDTISEGTPGIIYGNAAPTAGTWVKGDIVYNANPSVGQPIGWTCTVAGTPGTWVAWANL